MRFCEYPGCPRRGDRSAMVQMPNGEWYCPRHAPPVEQDPQPADSSVRLRWRLDWRLTLHSPKGYDFRKTFATPEALRQFIEQAIQVDHEDPAREVN